MTDPMMHLRSLVEQTPDADILRDMISFGCRAVVWSWEVGGLTGAGVWREVVDPGSSSATATASAIGRRARGPSSCASPS